VFDQNIDDFKYTGAFFFSVYLTVLALVVLILARKSLMGIVLLLKNAPPETILDAKLAI
jgi:hypothetical protein